MRVIGIVSVLCIAVLLSACSTIRYLGQAARGEMDIWWRRQPIDTLLANPDTDPNLKRRLKLVLEIRNFASDQLALPENDSYRYYADIHRSHVVWNVFAAGEFSVKPKQWCFPIAGCVSYRGYFSRRDAERYAAQLQREGFETYVGGVTAYSTLGWFDDPVLNTVLNYDDAHLAGLIFHELAHQRLYLPGDTTFNESFAVAVEVEGVKRWLTQRGKPGQVQEYLRELKMRRDFIDIALGLRKRLADLYRSGVGKPEMRARKAALISEFITGDYAAFKRRWHDTSQLDNWVKHDLNNAKLVTLSSYYQWLPAFQALLRASGNDFATFYHRAAAIAHLDAAERRRRLQSLSPGI